MSSIINFFINRYNLGYLAGIALITVIGTLFLGTFYFFVYSYVINKRVKNPDKNRRLRLPAPRFGCAIIACIMLIGTCLIMKPHWVTNFSYVDFIDEVSVGETYTYDELLSNDSFTLYQKESDLFKYSLFYNNNFNGICTGDGKNCEYVLYVDYIDSDQNINGDYICEQSVRNIEKTDMLGYGVINTCALMELPNVCYGATDAYDMLAIEIRIYSPEKFNEKEKQIQADEIIFDENYFTASEQVYFDCISKSFSDIKMN